MDTLRVFVVAGEPSGDELGARLMAALRRLCGDKVRFAGVGGPAMEAEGLQSLFPMAELSVMGLVEVLPHIPRLLARIKQTAAAVDAMSPDVVVTIDSPSFAHRVVRRIRNRYIPRIHYVAPTVWAWRPWRVKGIRKDFDLVLCLLPFEAPFFEKAGVPCRYVGHPVVEYGADRGDGPAFRRKYGIAEDDAVICVLLGSRRSEVTRLAKPFAGALALLARKHPSLKAVVPTVGGVAGLVRELCDAFPVPTLVVQGREEKYAAMAASNAAIAASGTVALEIALARLARGHRLQGVAADGGAAARADAGALRQSDQPDPQARGRARASAVQLYAGDSGRRDREAPGADRRGTDPPVGAGAGRARRGRRPAQPAGGAGGDRRGARAADVEAEGLRSGHGSNQSRHSPI